MIDQGSGASGDILVQRTLFASTPFLCQSDGPFAKNTGQVGNDDKSAETELGADP
jgi:hypothetical protein